jgi:hypothetical protein
MSAISVRALARDTSGEIECDDAVPECNRFEHVHSASRERRLAELQHEAAEEEHAQQHDRKLINCA